MSFEQAFAQVIGHEGGYVNHPRDPGGATHWGISQRSYPQLDIAHLSQQDAKAIYQRDYWDRAQCDQLPPGVALALFDAAVNSGIGNAIRFLQRAVGVPDDGALGPRTLAAVAALTSATVQARQSGQRLAFMASLSTWDQFGQGWARRIAANLQTVGVGQ